MTGLAMTDLLHTASPTPSTELIPEPTLTHDVADITSASSWLTFLSDDYGLRDERLRELSTRQLRIMMNRVFKVIDSPHPPYGSLDLYETLADLIEERAQEAIHHSIDVPVRESFYDNALYRRFELHIDGTLAVYVKYRMTGGRIALIESVLQPEFRDEGIEATLLRHVFLNTHKRRLSVMPQCPVVFAFLADHPEYRVLAASGTAPSVHLHS